MSGFLDGEAGGGRLAKLQASMRAGAVFPGVTAATVAAALRVQMKAEEAAAAAVIGAQREAEEQELARAAQAERHRAMAAARSAAAAAAGAGETRHEGSLGGGDEHAATGGRVCQHGCHSSGGSGSHSAGVGDERRRRRGSGGIVAARARGWTHKDPNRAEAGCTRVTAGATNLTTSHRSDSASASTTSRVLKRTGRHDPSD